MYNFYYIYTQDLFNLKLTKGNINVKIIEMMFCTILCNMYNKKFFI